MLTRFDYLGQGAVLLGDTVPCYVGLVVRKTACEDTNTGSPDGKASEPRETKA